MKKILKIFCLLFLIVVLFVSCSKKGKKAKKIIRLAHNQAANHPMHKGMEAFKKFIEEKLGDKYDVQIFPSELLGSQKEMMQLVQTGAIDLGATSTAMMETYEPSYKIFNLPYLFASPEAYHIVMDDKSITGPIYDSTKKAGFQVVTWFDGGTRNVYAIKPINSPADLKGMKIRSQQSKSNMEMIKALGASPTPLGSGDVYTALQSKIVEGAENSEVTYVDSGQANAAKFYSYTKHQMQPDLLIANTAFLEKLPPEEKKIFEEGIKLINDVEKASWAEAERNAIKKAKEEIGVTFIYPDIEPFKKMAMPLHQKLLKDYPKLKPVYEKIQEINKKYPEKPNSEVKK